MKNIVALIGSLRQDSVNRILFNEYKKLAGKEFNIVEGEIKDIPFYNADDKEPAVVTKLAQQIKDADGVIFFSPEYNYSVPGVLKNALDFLSRSDKQPFNNKPAAILGASPSALGTGRMQYHLRQIGVFLNIYFMNKPEVMVNDAYNKIKDGKVVDEGTLKFLQTHIASFSEFLKKMT